MNLNGLWHFKPSEDLSARERLAEPLKSSPALNRSAVLIESEENHQGDEGDPEVGSVLEELAPKCGTAVER
jgi:hypothetical protein